MTRPNRTIDDITADLQVVLRRETGDILTIGGLLAEAKERISHGEWLPWLKTEFSMSERSAQKYVKAAAHAAKYELGADLKLSPSALFLLSRYDRPEITEAVIKASNEKHLGREQAKAIIDKTLAELDGGAQSHPKSRKGVNPRPQVELTFAAAVKELDRVTKTRQPDRFAKTAVELDVLARLGQFLTDIASRKGKDVALETSIEKAA